MKKGKLVNVLLSVAVALSGVTGATGFVSAQDDEAEVISVTTNGELAGIDSVYATDIPSLQVLGNVAEGLYRPASNEENELGVAAEEPTISEDGTVYTFVIRDDANWSNGEPVTAHDFVFTYRKALNPETLSENVNKFYPIKNAQAVSEGEVPVEELGVKAIDDKRLEFTLEAPTPYFTDLLAIEAFLPTNQKAAEEHGAAYGTSAETTVYNGAYILEDWSGTETSWTLNKNEDYWDAENVDIEEINFQVSKETSTNVNLFEAGDIQLTEITAPYVEAYLADDRLVVSPKGLEGYLTFNHTQEKTDNVNVRKALTHAIDKEAFVNVVLKDGSQAVGGWIPSGFASHPETELDFREENGDLNPYDLDIATEAWNTALEELGVDSLEIELLTSDTDTSKQASEFIQAQWQQNLPGLTVTIKNVPLKQRLDLQRAPEFDVVYGTFTPSYSDPIAFLEYFEEASPLNGGKYVSEAFETLIQDARTTLANDPVARYEALLEAEQVLIGDDAAVGTLYQGAYTHLSDENLSNVINQVNGYSYYFRLAELNH